MLQGTFFANKREQFYKICDSKAILVTIFCGLVSHFCICISWIERKKGTATCLSDTRSKTMSPSQKFPRLLDDKTAVPRRLRYSLCQERIWNMSSGLTLEGKYCWWKIPIESVANISLSSKNFLFWHTPAMDESILVILGQILGQFPCLVILGKNQRLCNSLYSCVDNWSRWDRSLYVHMLNKSKCKNILSVALAPAKELLRWKWCMYSSPQSATKSPGVVYEVDVPEDETWSCPKKAQTEELNMACHSFLHFETFSHIS